MGNGEHHAALGRAVELGDDQPGHPQTLVEFLGLRHRVLADGAVEHQQHFMRRPGIQAGEHALDLLELVHQMSLGVQASRGVGDQDIDIAGACGLQPVEDDGGGLCAALLGDDGNLIALGPHLQLLARRGAKSVAGGQHDAAPLGEQPVRQFADGGGLAGAVDSHHQNDIGLDVRVDGERLFHGLQDLEHGIVQGLEQRVHVVQFLARHALAQLLENSARGLGAHIGGDQAGLEFVEDVRIDLAAGQQFGEVGGEPGGTHVQLGAQALEKTAHFRDIGFVRHGRYDTGSDQAQDGFERLERPQFGAHHRRRLARPARKFPGCSRA